MSIHKQLCGKEDDVSGNKIGGLKARAKNLARDPDHYRKAGAIGGKMGRTGGFYGNSVAARTAGRRGGMVSSRQENKPSLAVRRGRATRKLKDPFKELFGEMEPFAEGFGKSRWYDRLRIWRKHERV